MKVSERVKEDEELGIKKPATEGTLQSIDSTLKRIEKILLMKPTIENAESKKSSPRHRW